MGLDEIVGEALEEAVVLGDSEGNRADVGEVVGVELGVALDGAAMLTEMEHVGGKERPGLRQTAQGQGVGAPLPAMQKLPTGQMNAVELQEPAGQK